MIKTARTLFLLGLGLVLGLAVAPAVPQIKAKGVEWMGKLRAGRKAPPKEVALATPARPAPLSAPKPAAGLKPAEATEVVRTLGADAAGLSADSTPVQVVRFLEGSGGRMAVADLGKVAAPERPWVAEFLPGNIAYWRVRTLGVPLAEAIGRDWAVWRQKNPLGAVLDLRECQPAQSLEAVAEVCGLFVTPGEVLFTWRDGTGREKVYRSDRQPLGLGGSTPLLILVGPNLRGAGELVAAILQERSGAILLGQATAGQPGWLGETRLSSGRSFFRSRGELLLPGGRGGMGQPLPPDVDLASGGFADAEIWSGGEMTIAATVAEVAPIQRATESSLMKDEDMNLEDMLPTSPAGKETEVKRPPQDRGLQRAGDLLRALRKLPPSKRSAFDPRGFQGHILTLQT